MNCSRTIGVPHRDDEPDEVPPIDLNFPAIIEGVSFVVLPVAIFA